MYLTTVNCVNITTPQTNRPMYVVKLIPDKVIGYSYYIVTETWRPTDIRVHLSPEEYIQLLDSCMLKEYNTVICEHCSRIMSLITNNNRIANIYKTNAVFNMFKDEITGIYECTKCNTITASYD